MLKSLPHPAECWCGWFSNSGCKVIDSLLYWEREKKKKGKLFVSHKWTMKPRQCCHSIEMYYFYFILVFATFGICSRSVVMISLHERSAGGGGEHAVVYSLWNENRGWAPLDARIQNMWAIQLQSTTLSLFPPSEKKPHVDRSVWRCFGWNNASDGCIFLVHLCPDTPFCTLNCLLKLFQYCIRY